MFERKASDNMGDDEDDENKSREDEKIASKPRSSPTEEVLRLRKMLDRAETTNATLVEDLANVINCRQTHIKKQIQSQKDKFEERLQAYQMTMVKCKKENEDLQKENADLQKENANLKDENTKLKFRCLEILERSESHEKLFNTHELKIKEIMSKWDKEKIQYKKIIIRFDEEKCQVHKRLETEIEAHRKCQVTVKEHKETIISLTKQYTEYVSASRNSDEMTTKVNLQMDTLRSSMEELKVQYHHNLERLKQMEISRTMLQDDHIKLKYKYKRQGKELCRLESIQGKSHNQKIECGGVKTLMPEQTNFKQRFVATRDSFRSHNKTLKAKIKRLEDEKEKKNKIFKEQMKDKENKYMQLEKDYQLLRKNMEEEVMKRDRTEEYLDNRLKAEQRELLKYKERKIYIEKEYTKLKDENEIQQQKYMDALNTWKQDKELLRKHEIRLNEIMSNINEDKHQLKQKMIKLEEEKHQSLGRFTRMETSRAFLQNQYLKLKTKYKTRGQEVRRLENIERYLEGKIKDLQNELISKHTATERYNNSKQHDFIREKAQIKDKEYEGRSLTLLHEQTNLKQKFITSRDSFRSQNKTLKAKIKRLEDEREKFLKQLHQEKNECIKMKKEIEMLYTSVDQEKEENDKMEKHLQNQVNMVKSQKQDSFILNTKMNRIKDELQCLRKRMVEAHENESNSEADKNVNRHIKDLMRLEDAFNSCADNCGRPRTVKEIKSCISLLKQELEDALNNQAADDFSFQGNTKALIDKFEQSRENSFSQSMCECSCGEARSSDFNNSPSPTRENFHNISNAKAVSINNYSFNIVSGNTDNNGNMFRRVNSNDPAIQ